MYRFMIVCNIIPVNGLAIDWLEINQQSIKDFIFYMLI